MSIDWNKPQPAPRALWQVVHAQFPQTRSDGIYNNRNVAGSTTPSLHAEGRALDIGLRTTHATEKIIGDRLFEMFVKNATQLGLQEIIWNRQIFSSTVPHVHPYTGQDAHTDHIHVGFTRAASQNMVFPSIMIDLATIRTGLEDLSRGIANIG